MEHVSFITTKIKILNKFSPSCHGKASRQDSLSRAATKGVNAAHFQQVACAVGADALSLPYFEFSALELAVE